ncbi:MAG: DUF559 domain-containing protein [Ignavibacteriales bacterium]|nr:DUF559 domain-containing protein [Ignavibacteriales bacterium]
MQKFNKKAEKENRRFLRREETPAEKIIWHHLRNRQLLGVKFRRQYSVFQFSIDFYAPYLKFAVEIDGSVHDEPEQHERDIFRQQIIEELDIQFLRITNDELFENPNKALKKITTKTQQIKSEQPTIKENGTRKIKCDSPLLF